MFTFLLKQLLQGNSIARAMMNFHMQDIAIAGTVIDVGGGRGASYLPYMKKSEGTQVLGFDLKESAGVVMQLNFETDRLPRDDGSADHVLMFNILEHIYNHQFLVGEVARILKSGGTLTGFVPFLVNYHPDPHDYFRYTSEALVRILEDAGLSAVVVRPVGKGPFLVNLNNIAPSLPRVCTLAIFPFSYALDTVLVKLRPNIGKRYPLGYLFTAKK